MTFCDHSNLKPMVEHPLDRKSKGMCKAYLYFGYLVQPYLFFTFHIILLALYPHFWLSPHVSSASVAVFIYVYMPVLFKNRDIK